METRTLTQKELKELKGKIDTELSMEKFQTRLTDRDTLFKTLESFITYIQTGKEDEFSMKFDGYEAMAKHINEGGLKLPECDWCGERIDGRGSYYANGNQEGKLCHDCHVKEISYSNDRY